MKMMTHIKTKYLQINLVVNLDLTYDKFEVE